MKKVPLLIYAAGTLLLCSCATTYQYVSLPDQDKAVADSGKARIYVMRPAFFATAISIQVEEDHVPVGRTGPKGYICWETTPDEKILTSKSENTSNITLHAEEGNVYYLHQHVLLGWTYARSKLELVADEQKAMKMLKKCRAPVVKLK